MKHLHKSIVIKAAGIGLLLCAVLMACNNYLDVKPQGQIDEGAATTDPEAATNLVTGIYTGFPTWALPISPRMMRTREATPMMPPPRKACWIT